MYEKHFAGCTATFERWGRNLVNGFRHYQEKGFVEVITCGATHGFLPLMVTESAVRAQIQIAVNNYKKHFGRRAASGCLNAPTRRASTRISKKPASNSFSWTRTASSSASRAPRFGPFRPVYCPSGVAAFARDAESSRQVWSSEEGYPGDVDYREFYRDLGYDAGLSLHQTVPPQRRCAPQRRDEIPPHLRQSRPQRKAALHARVGPLKRPRHTPPIS